MQIIFRCRNICNRRIFLVLLNSIEKEFATFFKTLSLVHEQLVSRQDVNFNNVIKFIIGMKIFNIRTIDRCFGVRWF